MSDLFVNRPDADAGDVEEMLLQVMQDEFDVNLEDDSEEYVAQLILKLRKETAEGNFDTVRELHSRWQQRKGKASAVRGLQVIEHAHDGGGDEAESGDDSEEESDEDGEDEDEDVEMMDSQEQSRSTQKPEPEVDADGFTKVVGKKRR